MGWQWIRRVLEQSQAAGTERLILIVLAEHANDIEATGSSFPSVDRIARLANTGERNVRKCVAKLIKLGELQVDSQAARRGCNAYRIRLSATEPAFHHDDASAEPAFHKGGTVVPSNGTVVPQGRNCGSPEPEVTTNEPPITRTGKRDPLSGFEAFYQAYPRKKAKPKAEALWAKLKPAPELQSVIIKAATALAASPDAKRDGGKFLPYPATWIKDRRWEDETQQIAGVYSGASAIDF